MLKNGGGGAFFVVLRKLAGDCPLTFVPLEIVAEVARSVNAGTTGLMPKELAKRQLETARQLMAERARAELEQSAAEHGNTPEAERAVLDTPVEREDGSLATLSQLEEVERLKVEKTKPSNLQPSNLEPSNPPGMRPAPSGEPGVYVHGAVPEARVEAGAEIDMPDGTRVNGVLIKGLDPAEMLRPERRDAVADFLIEVIDGAQGRVAFENPEAEAAARELLKERVAREETQAQRQAEQEIVDAGQNLVDGLFGKESGIKVRRGTPEEAMEAAEGVVGKNAAVELLKDTAGEILGYWDQAKKEVVLFGGASAETLGHEIAWHAVRQWAETHSPELLAKMNEYAKRCPEELRELIKKAYKDFRGDALLDEIGAGRFENELGGRFRELLGRNAEARTWWEGVKATLKEMWQAFVKMIDGGGIDLSRLEKMDADEGMRWLVDQMLQGRRLEGGGEHIRVDHKWTDGQMRYSLKAGTASDYSWATLTAKPDMPLAQIDPEKFKNYETDSERVSDAHRSVIAAGGEKIGDNYYIRMDGERVLVGGDGIKHRGRKPNLANDFVFPVLGEVLKNAVRVNELEPRANVEHDKNITDTFVYLGALSYGQEVLPVRIQVEHRGNEHRIDRIDVLRSLNTKIGSVAALGGLTPALQTEPTISISNLIRIAQPLHREIFSRDVAAALGVPYEGGTINARYSISGIYTGTAADYANRSRQGGKDDGPSLKKIGTGEGSQVYGWGLYGSNVRGVAEGYMKNGIRDPRVMAKNFLAANKTAEAAIKALKEGLKINKSVSEEVKKTARKAIKILQSGESIPETIGNLYEQTFFTDRAPGDESHLLKWYEPVSEE